MGVQLSESPASALIDQRARADGIPPQPGYSGVDALGFGGEADVELGALVGLADDFNLAAMGMHHRPDQT